jgi:hypothetical protein
VSLTLDPSRIWQRPMVSEELERLATELRELAKVEYRRGMAIISLICNVERTSEILERVFRVRQCAGLPGCPSFRIHVPVRAEAMERVFRMCTMRVSVGPSVRHPCCLFESVGVHSSICCLSI